MDLWVNKVLKHSKNLKKEQLIPSKLYAPNFFPILSQINLLGKYSLVKKLARKLTSLRTKSGMSMT